MMPAPLVSGETALLCTGRVRIAMRGWRYRMGKRRTEGRSSFGAGLVDSTFIFYTTAFCSPRCLPCKDQAMPVLSWTRAQDKTLLITPTHDLPKCSSIPRGHSSGYALLFGNPMQDVSSTLFHSPRPFPTTSPLFGLSRSQTCHRPRDEMTGNDCTHTPFSP